MGDTAPPYWIILTKVEPKSAADAERLLGRAHPHSLRRSAVGYSKDDKSGGVIVMATGEANLATQVATLKGKYAIDIWVGAPPNPLP
jgi:hypothetical protein